VFDQKLGEVFVVRTAGEALDSAAIASIEYAVAHLGSQLLVVMGHSSCGAIKEALGNMKLADMGSAHLNALVGDIVPRLKPFESAKEPSKDLIRESTLNAHVVAQDLQKRSKIISDAVAAGKLSIHSALYHVKYGKVIFN
jgi:carbonic anhydrase